MPARSGKRRIAHALGWIAVALVAVSPAAAKKAAKAPSRVAYAAASLIPIPKFPEAPSREKGFGGAQAPASYFTIAGALARHDARREGGAIRLAAIDPADPLEDDLSASTSALPPSTSPPKKSEEPFGTAAFRAPEGQLWAKWRRLSQELADDEKTLAGCAPEHCGRPATNFFNLVGQIKGLTGHAQLERVNLAVNTAIAYASDVSMHGELDRWSSPLATLQLGRGDCEDYAILKRHVLIHAGFKPADLRIVLLRDTTVRLDHAVLAARSEGQWFILDNRRGGFFQDRDVPHYMPLFALDQSGVKLFAAPFASLSDRAEDQPMVPGLDADEPASGHSFGPTLPLLF